MSFNKETMLEAFLRQTGIDPCSFEQTEEYEEMQNQEEQEVTVILNNDVRISEHIEIPTKLSDNQLDNKTIAHDNFKHYDHSLEMDRWDMIQSKIRHSDKESDSWNLVREKMNERIRNQMG